MRRKRDLHLNYDNNNMKRNMKGKRIIGTGIILIAFGFGLITFYLVNHPVGRKNSGGQPKIKQSSQKDQIQKDEKIQNGDQVKNEGKVQKEEQVQQEGKEILKEQEKSDELNKQVSTNGGIKNIVKDKEENNGNEQKLQDNKKQEVSQKLPVKVKGIYVTARIAGSQKLKELIDVADEKEINAFVIDIKDDYGKISYSMNSPLAKKIGATTKYISDIDALMKTLKAKNIYTIARIVAFKDPYLAEHRHDLALKNKDGSLYRDNKGECWVNPYKKQVWDYLVEVAESAANVGFDEIQFDYIRFCTDQGTDQVNYGKVALKKTKQDIIVEFTKYIYGKLKPLGVYVSADVFGAVISSSVDAKLVGQNYVEMSKYLDYICPMIYPSHFGEGNYGVDYPDLHPYEIIKGVLSASKTKLQKIPKGKHCAIVRPWLQDFTASWVKHHKSYGGAELKEQIAGVYDASYDEWLIWNSAGNFSISGLKDK